MADYQLSAPRPRSLLRDALRHLLRNRLALAGVIIVLLLIFVAIFAPLIAPMDPAVQHLNDKRMPPGTKYILGADEFGRDILSRVIFGSRVALFVAITAVAIAMLLGGTLGVIAGFVGGWLDALLMRVTDVMLAFPYLLLAIAIVAALGTGLENTTLAVGIWATPAFARLTRSQIIGIKGREYVTAARALGAPPLRLIFRHVLPNSIPPIIVFASLYMASAILLEAALSFLGLGIQPPQPSWGLMVASGRDFLRVAPHIATIPGVAIMLAVLGFNLMGDGLRDALDPTLRGRM
ncbi:MAG: ABC transporter permease [Caldilineaceae bacterium]|nr:ABC transporter permease [Caldilineaceae bacterium]